MAAAAIRVQNWGDTLRLPTFQTELATLASAVVPLRTANTPVPLQSKHLPALKRGLWYALRRPTDRARQGLLCVVPESRCCVYVSGDAPTAKFPTPRMALLRLRVDPQFLAPGTGMTVFAATLSPASRRLWVEDVLLWKGRNAVQEDAFEVRWRLAAQWLEHYCIVEPRLVDGIELALARWGSLESMEPSGAWFLQSADPGRRPLVWIHQDRAALAPIRLNVGSPDDAPVTSPAPFATAPQLDVGPLMAVATRETGPDQWALTSSDGVALGRALIRTLDVSSALRSVSGGRSVVEVEWNEGFTKWEIKAVASKHEMASPGSFFSKPR